MKAVYINDWPPSDEQCIGRREGGGGGGGGALGINGLNIYC